MAGTLQVENLIGPTSGANANKIIIPSGQELSAAGHVVQVLTYGINDTSVSAGVGKVTVEDWAFTKKFASSNVLVTMHVNYSNTDTTSNDDNSALFLLNVTNNTYLNRRGMYAEPDAWFGTDTNNNYGGSIPVNSFQYHKYTASTQLMDTSNTAGTITYRLQASVQYSTFRLGRWADNSITFTEIAQ
jgi:hypothetical protein